MIAKCTCRNEYQDKKYGKGRRVFTTPSVKGEDGKSIKKGKCRCTVCGKEKR